MKKFQTMILGALVIVPTACALAACNNHTHEFTELGHDETNHWYYCAEDDIKDESSVEAHKYTAIGSDDNQHWTYCDVCGVVDESSKANHVDADENGKCDVCEHTVPVPIKYGTLSGTLSLKKAGETTLSGEGVTISLSNKNGAVTPSELKINTDGTFSLTALEGEYSLTVSKDGYVTTTNEIELLKDEPVTGYSIVLEYKLLTVAADPGWDAESHDFSHQNDETPYFVHTATEGGHTLDVMTVDTYDDAMFTWYAKKGQSAHESDRVGVLVQFYNEEDSKTDFLWLTINGTSCRFEWEKEQIWKDWTNLRNICTDGNLSVDMTEEERNQFFEGTLRLSIARHENMIFALVNGVVRETIVLDEKYADMGAHLGMLGYDPCSTDGDNRFYFEITEDISDILPKETFTVELPTVDHLTITPSRTQGYAGQGVVLTLEPEENYEIISFKVGDVERVADIADGKLEIKNYGGEEISATVIEAKAVSAVVTATAYEGIELTFTRGDNVQSATVSDGKATFDGITGPWAVTTTYMGKEFSLGNVFIAADGTATIENGITIFSGKDIFAWDNIVESTFNPATGEGTLNVTGGNMVFHQTPVQYDNVAITQYVKKSTTGEGSGVFVMVGGKYIRISITHSGERKIEWDLTTWMDEWGGGDPVENITEKTNNWAFSAFDPWSQWHFFDSELNNSYQNGASITLTDEEMAMFEAGTLKLTLVRSGANIYVFVNDKYVAMRCLTQNDTMEAEDALQKATVGLVITGTSAGTSVNFKLETDISAYLAKCEGASSFKYIVNGEHVTVTGKTEGFNANDIAQISFEAEEGYRITAVKIDGVEVDVTTRSVARLVLTTDLADVAIEITTEKVLDPVDIEISVPETLNLEGATITFKRGDTTENVIVSQGKACFNGVPDLWAVSVNYNGTEFSLGNVNVDEEGKATLEKGIVLFTGKDIFQWDNYVDGTFNPVTGEGTLNVTSGNMVFHQSLAQYDNVAITQYVKKSTTGEGSGVFVMIDGKYIRISINHNGERKIEWELSTAFDDWSGNNVANITEKTNNLAFSAFDPWSQWHFFDSELNNSYQNGASITLTDEEMEMFEAGTLKLTLVRSGANIYVFVNDKYVAMRCLTQNDTMTAEQAAQKATVGLVITGTSVGTSVNYEVETDISAYLAKCEGASSFKYVVSGEHVTVTGKTEGFNVNDIAQISFAAEEGYVITSVKINGTEVDASTTSVARLVLAPDLADVTIEITTEPTPA